MEGELDNLSANMLSGVISATLARMLSEREAEKAAIEERLARATRQSPIAQILPHLELVRRFTQKVGALRATLDDEAIRTEAAELMDHLLESVTIYPDGPEAAVAASDGSNCLAQNDKTPRRLGRGACSVAVVAGVGFGRWSTLPIAA